MFRFVVRRGEIQAFLYVNAVGCNLSYSRTGKDLAGVSMRKMRGGSMRIEYLVIGAVAALVVVAGVSMLPDFIRYMKIRSM